MVKRGDGSMYRRKRKTSGSYGTSGRGVRRVPLLGESARDWTQCDPWKSRLAVVKKKK
jgi:hypothetical protein